MLDLEPFKKAAERLAELSKAPKRNLDAEINEACWLGERSHYLIAEIERLREEQAKNVKPLRKRRAK